MQTDRIEIQSVGKSEKPGRKQALLARAIVDSAILSNTKIFDCSSLNQLKDIDIALALLQVKMRDEPIPTDIPKILLPDSTVSGLADRIANKLLRDSAMCVFRGRGTLVNTLHVMVTTKASRSTD